MPAWIHDRAQHLLAKNPSMDKGQAFAIATQQSHALGKSPKKHGTAEGKAQAKAKYDKPRKEYVKTPNPGKLETPKLESRKKVAMYAFMKMAVADILSGGMGDKTQPSDVRPSELAKGKKVEMEHTDAEALASEIARDHLKEFPDYYTRLAKMEDEAKASKHACVRVRAMREELLKLADGDEGGEESGRAPTEEDKKAIHAFIANSPKGMKDEEFHEFLEHRGIKVPLGEAVVYDMARSKTASGCVLSFGLDGRRQGVEWNEDIISRIMEIPRTSGSMKMAAMKEAFQRSAYHGAGVPWGPSFMKTDAMPDPSRVAASQLPAQEAIENMKRKMAAANAITPAGRLAASMQVGRPPAALAGTGPSVASVSKIKGPGSGTAMSGAKAGGAI